MSGCVQECGQPANGSYRHGRDGKLHIWQLGEEDEVTLSKLLPIDDAVVERKQPWLLHTLLVSAINFCSFASLPSNHASPTHSGRNDELLIATPGIQDGSINVTTFPTENRIATIPAPKGTNTGMLMAIGLYYGGKNRLTVIGGYESGHAALFQQNATGHWECLYIHKAHAQPVLAVAICSSPNPGVQEPSKLTKTGSFFTSAADAIIARHPLPSTSNTKPSPSEAASLQTRHAGQQSLTLRSDNVIFATAGWDGRVRVYSAKTMKEMAVLKWHKDGCYAVAFAEVKDDGINGVGNSHGGEVAKRNLTVAEKRVEKAQSTHWLAAGSKDGKVSLWEVY